MLFSPIFMKQMLSFFDASVRCYIGAWQHSYLGKGWDAADAMPLPLHKTGCVLDNSLQKLWQPEIW